MAIGNHSSVKQVVGQTIIKYFFLQGANKEANKRDAHVNLEWEGHVTGLSHFQQRQGS